MSLYAPCGLAVVWLLPLAQLAADDAPAFFRGLNLNGPSVTIDGRVWEGRDSTHYVCKDKAFENQNVPLSPSTDPERAQMIRSSRWGGNRIELTDLPPGTFTLFLYVWEDNSPETFSIAINGQEVQSNYTSGPAGRWEKLGPWYTQPQSGKIVLTSRGGAANFSGIELWRGRYDGLETALSEEDLAFFEKRIRPLLVEKCYECHSAESKELQGDLLVDSRATLRRGGASGPAVVPGDLERSLLIQAVRYQREELQMPPDGKLSDREIADLERWVQIGAPDPRSTVTKHAGRKIDLAAAREFWSLKPIVKPAVPTVQKTDWPRNDIDRFVLAQLEARGLQPSPDADKRALLRRVTYDLIGLPPTPEEVAAFLADESPDAFAAVVDRLLDSPRYGERWGRHWLDVVRYADTAGDNSDYPIPQMHRYRDWVIDAFNRDLPYDEFVRDQLAGDLRGGRTESERYGRIIATGYIANARRFGSRVDDYPQHLTIEDTIDNLGRTFLGLTLSCTRCHDHKFDPLTNRDYYALYGIFQSTRYPWPGIELDKRQREFVPLVPRDQIAEAEKALEARKKEQARLDGEVKKLKDALKQAPEGEKAALQEQVKDAERRAKEHVEQPPPHETAYAVIDAATRTDAAIQLKGDPNRTGDVVPRRFLEVLGGQALPDDCNASGREQLAEWILAEDNPLTARVIANRIWQHHFGRGIVPTPNDFGRQGKPPTHPELLDWLAIALVKGSGLRAKGQNGPVTSSPSLSPQPSALSPSDSQPSTLNSQFPRPWSIKALHRLILSSRTYQQSATRSPQAVALDPANDWLAGYPRRRLDAEAIRDTLLALGGNLDLSPPGPHPFPPQHTWDFTQHKPFKAVYESNHRSVYLMTQRIQRHPFLAIFDGADPSTSTAARLTSTTPLQALYFLNDPFVHEQARRVADRILAYAADDTARIQWAYELLFCRPADDGETTAARQFLYEARRLWQNETGGASDAEIEPWRAYVRSLFRLNEFVYLD